MADPKTDKISIVISALLTIVFEVVVAVLVYNEIGDDRVAISVFRLILQLLFLVLIMVSNSRVAIYVLTFYHVILGLEFFTKDIESLYLLFGIYHILIGLMIYFNAEIDVKLKKLLLKS